MTTLSLYIDKAEVMLEVARITNYEAAKAQQAVKDSLTEANGTPYSQIFTADADEDLLDNYWQAACMNAASKMDYYLTEVKIGEVDIDDEGGKGVGIKLVFSMPSNYNDVVADLIKGNLKLSLANYIVGDWFAVALPPKSEFYFTKAGEQLTTTRDLLFRRNRPITVNPDVPEKSFVSVTPEA